LFCLAYIVQKWIRLREMNQRLWFRTATWHRIAVMCLSKEDVTCLMLCVQKIVLQLHQYSLKFSRHTDIEWQKFCQFFVPCVCVFVYEKGLIWKEIYFKCGTICLISPKDCCKRRYNCFKLTSLLMQFSALGLSLSFSFIFKGMYLQEGRNLRILSHNQTMT
jgi:hypothetical protein